MSAPVIKTSFSNGEIAPSLWGHVELSRYGAAAATMRNCVVGFRGGAYSRAGTQFIGYTLEFPTFGRDVWPRLIPFQFNTEQSYVLEFGNQYIRFISGGGYVLEPAVFLGGASQTDPCTLFSLAPGHGYNIGDWIVVNGVFGMSELNGRTFVVTGAAPGSFTIATVLGVPVDATGYGAYIGGGYAQRVYTIGTPYAIADVRKLKFAQSADVMSLTHPDYPPYELSRLGPTSWTFAPANFGANISAPASCTVTATAHPDSGTSPPTLPCAYAFVVTAIDAETGQESVASPVANVTDSVNVAATAGSLIVDWATVPGAGSYNVYRAPPSYNSDSLSTTTALAVPVGALFGYVATAFGAEYIDSNSTPDYTHTPPLHRNPFAPGQILEINITSSSSDWTTATASIASFTGSGFVGEVVISNGAVAAILIRNAGIYYQDINTVVITGDGSSATASVRVGSPTGTYPGVVAYYQQRRVYASSRNRPDTFWMSQPGAFTNFDTSIPVSDADAITGTPIAEQVNGIQWAMAMPLGLVMFTGGGAWQVAGSQASFGNPSAVTPANEIATPLTSIGANDNVPPIRINNDILYLQSKGSTIRDLAYQIYFQQYTATDISWQSSHLLEGSPIVSWAWCEEPSRVLWAAREDGVLLSLTYVKEQEVTGMARHDTQGLVRDVCSVTEGDVDALYMVVERFDGAGHNYFSVERLDDRIWRSVEDCWCVDAGVATSRSFPDARVSATSASGAVVFATDADAFASSDVGAVLRMGGGIATIGTYVNARVVGGTWVKPCRELIPGDPGGRAVPQRPGKWSLSQPVSTVRGLDHLAGQQVVGLADGVPIGPLTVSGAGLVTLPFTASRIILGLGYTAQIQSVYLDTGQPTIQGRRKAIYAVTTRLEASAVPDVGANQVDTAALRPTALYADWTLPSTPAPAGGPETYQSPGAQTVTDLYTGDVRVAIPAGFDRRGQVAVQQTRPLPLNLIALVPEIVPGDEVEIGYSQRPSGGMSRAGGQRQAG